MRQSIVARWAGAVFVLGTVTAQAQPSGQLNFGGTVNATAAGTNVLLNFLPSSGSPNVLPNVVALGGNSGGFAIFNPLVPIPGVFGILQSPIVGVGPTPMPGWLTIGGYTFNLLSIAPGAYSSAACFAAPAIGQTCSPPGIGLNLANVPSGAGVGSPISSTASVSVAGNVVGPVGTSSFFGTLTAQVPGQSYQQLFSTIASPGGSATVSFSATLVAVAAPEPSTGVLAAIGLAVLGGVAFRRRRVA